MTNSQRNLGQSGESLAARSLERLGWTIVERNWRGPSGEVDLLALDDDVLVLVEVKTRRGAARGAAEEAINPAKAARLLRLGEEYVALHPEHQERYWRVDLIAITLDSRGMIERVNHIESACEV